MKDDFMKVKIISKKVNYDKYRKMLEKAGFTIDEDANLVFKEEDYTPIHFVGKINDQYSIIPFDVVVYMKVLVGIYFYIQKLTITKSKKNYTKSKVNMKSMVLSGLINRIL